jgi:hypothetical protein
LSFLLHVSQQLLPELFIVEIEQAVIELKQSFVLDFECPHFGLIELHRPKVHVLERSDRVIAEDRVDGNVYRDNLRDLGSLSLQHLHIDVSRIVVSLQLHLLQRTKPHQYVFSAVRLELQLGWLDLERVLVQLLLHNK